MEFRETEKAELGEEIRQGDIFRLECARPDSINHSYGAVINADCDLEHDKTDGVITYLPIYPFYEFYNKFWIEGYLERVSLEETRRIIDILKVSDVEAQNIVNWLSSADSEEVLIAIKEEFKLKKANIIKIQEALEKIKICISKKEGRAKFSLLCQFASSPSIFAEKQIKSAKKDIGDGHFYFNEIAGIESVGFVIRMRRAYSIPSALFFTSEAEKLANSNGTETVAVRFAKFTPLIRFKIVQNFAHQFSRIGLPDDVEALQDLAVGDLVDRYLGD